MNETTNEQEVLLLRRKLDLFITYRQAADGERGRH